ncbi:MAG TPA: nuclear transport factor 2 family protein, partial [Sphingomicrobium sp.]|nr:nuclear transport factor 2 family protein [Sphingomicrobium sp.]
PGWPVLGAGLALAAGLSLALLPHAGTGSAQVPVGVKAWSPAALRGAQAGEQASTAAEQELRLLDLRHSALVQAGNAEALAELLHPEYTVHLPNGRLVTFEQTMGLVRSGSLARERHQRAHERIVIRGDTAIVMGVDRLEQPPPLALRGERTRRYTNIYVREDGRWRLIARHFHFLP